MARIPCPFELSHAGLWLATIDAEAEEQEDGSIKYFVLGLDSFRPRREGERELRPGSELYEQCKEQFEGDPLNSGRMEEAVHEAKRSRDALAAEIEHERRTGYHDVAA